MFGSPRNASHDAPAAERALARSLAAALVAACIAGPAFAQQGDLQVEQGRMLLQQQRIDEAREVFEAVVDDEPANVLGHYYLGQAYGMLGRHEDAQHSFLTAVSLAPGFAAGHRFAAVASYQMGDIERAWEEAILATRAGADMRDAFAMMSRTAEPPADVDDRLGAPRIFVEEPDMSGVGGARNWGFEDHVGGVESLDEGPGTMSQGAAITNSDLPFTIAFQQEAGGSITAAAQTNYTSVQLLRENQSRIDEVMRQFRTTIAHGRSVGLVADPGFADYRLQMIVNELSGAMAGKLVGCDLMPGGAGSQGGGFGDADVDTDVYSVAHPKKLIGKLVLIDNVTGETVYDAPLNMGDISSLADLRFRIGIYVQEIESWAASSRGN